MESKSPRVIGGFLSFWVRAWTGVRNLRMDPYCSLSAVVVNPIRNLLHGLRDREQGVDGCASQIKGHPVFAACICFPAGNLDVTLGTFLVLLVHPGLTITATIQARTITISKAIKSFS